jgi:hypothetical protein
MNSSGATDLILASMRYSVIVVHPHGSRPAAEHEVAVHVGLHATSPCMVIFPLQSVNVHRQKGGGQRAQRWVSLNGTPHRRHHYKSAQDGSGAI